MTDNQIGSIIAVGSAIALALLPILGVLRWFGLI
jgi:hypothetical protein